MKKVNVRNRSLNFFATLLNGLPLLSNLEANNAIEVTSISKDILKKYNEDYNRVTQGKVLPDGSMILSEQDKLDINEVLFTKNNITLSDSAYEFVLNILNNLFEIHPIIKEKGLMIGDIEILNEAKEDFNNIEIEIVENKPTEANSETENV